MDKYELIAALADAANTFLRDFHAAHAPEPTKEQIEFLSSRDQLANPHNDSYKPPRRSRLEIIAMLKFEYADAMIAARHK